MLSDRNLAMVREFNPWWEGKQPQVPAFEREVLGEIQRFMRTKQMLALVGLRRVGKTTVLKQLLGKLIAAGTPPENVFYFLFDDLSIRKPEDFEDIVDYYLKTVRREGRCYVFLDEIQKIPHWQDVLMRFYETREDVKFLVSGSSSLQIKKSKESLAGRLIDFHVPILTFREFLAMNGTPVKKIALTSKALREAYEENVHKREFFRKLLGEYVMRGAFPELASEVDDLVSQKYIRSAVIEKVIYEDVPDAFGATRRDVLYGMLEYCARETSTLLDLQKLAATLSASYATVRPYLFYLQNAFLLDLVYNTTGSAVKQMRTSKKVHVAHPCFTISLMRQSKEILQVDEVMGKYLETVIFAHAKLLDERPAFWRSPQKDEVDLVIKRDGVLLPIEVKYRNRADISSSDGLPKFMRKYRIPLGIAVTKDLFEERTVDGQRILFVPAWLFLWVV